MWQKFRKISYMFFYGHIHEQRFTVVAFINKIYVIGRSMNKKPVKANFLHERSVMLMIMIERYTVAEFLNNKLVIAAAANKIFFYI